MASLIRQVKVSVFDDSSATFTTDSALDLAIITVASKRALEGVTGMMYDDFMDGMARLVGPVTEAAA